MRQGNPKRAKRNKRLFVLDEAPLHKPSRARYMELRKLLMNPNGPSIHITTAELADVVNGREDIPLPDWATVHAFEAELESLIENNTVVSVCWDCDSVISFFHDLKLGKLIAPELAIVQQSEKVPCPYCGSLRIANYDPKVLTTGEKVCPLDMNDYDDELEAPADAHQAVDSQQISPNEQYLDKLLRTEYDIQPDKQSDVFNISEYTLDRISNKFAREVSDWGETPGLPTLDPNALESFRKQLSLSLRADAPGGKSSVLGHIWYMVKDILADDYPEFCDVAVGMAVSRGISASMHLGDSGEMAVIVEMGLFFKLPRLNHLLSLIFDTDMLLRHDKGPDWTIDDIVTNIIAELTDKPIDQVKGRRIPELNYHSQEEFLRSRFITDAQIVFAILHELGHLADWKTSPQLAHHNIKDPSQRASAIEAWADAWAMDLIFKRGKEFLIPWVRYRAIFWLFEYWHLMDVVLLHSNTIHFNSRCRWDLIESMIRRRNKHEGLGQLYIYELRTIFDITVNKMEAT